MSCPNCTDGIIRYLGRNNDEIIEDCPHCSAQPTLMTETPNPTPDLTFPADVAALIDEAYAQGHDYGPNIQRSTMQLLAQDGSVIREVHWPQVEAWARVAIEASLQAVMRADSDEGSTTS